jgi:putative CocE/NonD family hydrolase
MQNVKRPLLAVALFLGAGLGASAQIKDQSSFDSLIGTYQEDENVDVRISVFREGSHAYVRATRGPKTELLPVHGREFKTKDGKAQISFTGGNLEWRPKVGKPHSAHRVANQPEPDTARPYELTEAMIPMRDGIKLHTLVLRPKDASGPLPFLFERTPYGVDDGGTSEGINNHRPELAASGYIFVMQDIRGRYKSEGEFLMARPLLDHSNPKSVDESTDAYDSVEWLLKNVPNNNGRAGVIGVSYDGFTTAMAGIDPHPAVKAISPQAPVSDFWLGDDFFHNGAFRQTYGYEYAKMMETSKVNTDVDFKEDSYTWYLKAGSFNGARKKSEKPNLPTWVMFGEHPSFDSFWEARDVAAHLKGVSVPTLTVGGWWDQEDFFGPQALYDAWEPHDTNHVNFLVLGAWNHGGWNGPGRTLGAVNFGAPRGDEYRKQIEAPFFAHYLKDEGKFDVVDTATFQTGSNRWMRYPTWPPKDGINQKGLYLGTDGKLTFDAPSKSANPEFRSYVSDPADPAPYRKRPIEATYSPKGSGWYTWLVEDQRFLKGRQDVLSWTTDTLTEDVTVTGRIVAELFAATSGTDSDWVVKLIDAYPDPMPADAAPEESKMGGYQLMIADEIFRGRYLKGFDHPEAIPANEVEHYKIDLHTNDHCFRKGHRIMVQVQSTWFPLYDRNPQRFISSIMLAKPSDFQKATQKIYDTAEFPSHITLPVTTK